MTIQEAIDRIDELKPNAVERTDKVRWLSQLDGTVLKEVVSTHEMSEEEQEKYAVIDTAYNDESELDTELLVPFPYDDVYIRWLEAQVDYWNGETNRYSNSMTMFNNAWSAFFNYYNSTHMPKAYGHRYF